MNTALTYGLYVAAANIVYYLIMYFTGAWKSEEMAWLGFLTIIFLAVGIYMAVKERKQEEWDGFMRFGQGFSTGLTVAVVAGIVGAIFYFVYLSYINPEIVDFMKDQMAKGMAEQEKQMTAEEFERAKEMGGIFIEPGMQAVWTFVVTIIVGSIISTIVSAIMKRNPEPTVAA